MLYRPLPRSDLAFSEVGFGTWTVSSTRWGVRGPEESAYLLRRALDIGVTFFQTIDVLDAGEGEIALMERHARAVQCVYNLAEQDPMRALFPVAQDAEASLIFREADVAGQQGDKLRALESVLKNYGLTLAQVALQWALHQPA